MNGKTGYASLAGTARTMGDLLVQGARLGMGLLGSYMPAPRRTGGCDCDILPPCWAPQPLGDVRARVCPGNEAVLRLDVTNCGAVGRTIHVSATDPGVAVAPASLTLGPMEQGLVVLSLKVPAAAPEGETKRVTVWIRGCKEQFLRWTIEVVCKGADCCADLEVEDCPDLVHHWYDHFYCRRPCVHQG